LLLDLRPRLTPQPILQAPRCWREKTDEVWKSIDDLQKAMEAVPPADRSGPEWGGDGELSKRFIELMKRLGDIGHQFRLGLAAIEQSTVMGNKKN
jgi:hypothetical protein